MAEKRFGIWLVGLVGVTLGWLGGPLLALALRRPETVKFWKEVGEALAPINTMLTLAAVVGALLAVHFQRVELRETREEMKEQRKQFERTAEAQEELARSQKLLAEAQLAANKEAAALRLAQHSNTIATMDAALGTLDAAEAIATTINQNEGTREKLKKALEERRQSIGTRIHRELAAEAKLSNGAA